MTKGIYVRECYENGNENGVKIYEVHAMCNCCKCVYRYNTIRKGVRNTATATTKDSNKVEEVKKFLESWNCEKDYEDLRSQYFTF